uniref:Uncharacterized protein n=1 Tax=Rhizophora mucronata TaxID=61149 RepID=A0A2P2NNS4_RHIMU
MRNALEDQSGQTSSKFHWGQHSIMA